MMMFCFLFVYFSSFSLMFLLNDASVLMFKINPFLDLLCFFMNDASGLMFRKTPFWIFLVGFSLILTEVEIY